MSDLEPVRIGLLGAQSTRNLGDTAIFSAAISAYRRRVATSELYAIVPTPEETARALGVHGFPLDGAAGALSAAHRDHRSKLAVAGLLPFSRLASIRRIHRFVGRLDALVFTGGGLFDDFWGGAGNLPFWILAWTAAARAHGIKVSFHAVGVDRLQSVASRTFARVSVGLAHYRSFRDAQSEQMMRSLGMSAPSEVVPDLAFGLQCPASEPSFAASERPFVIVNPASRRMWTHGQDDGYKGYLDAFVALSASLIGRGLSVKLLSTQDRMDDDALSYVTDRLRRQDMRNFERLQVTELDRFMRLASAARLVVSSRLHGLILGLVAGTPVISVAPMRKMTRLMADAGIGEFNVPVDGLHRAVLIAAAHRALEEETRLRRHVAATVAEFRHRVDRSFDRMLHSGALGERAQRCFATPA